MHLSSRKVRHSYDQIGVGGRVSRELREALSKLLCGVFACHHEQIVERRDTSIRSPPGEPLIHTVKERSARWNLIEQQAATAIPRKAIAP
jgi:hypothetical protein